MTKYIIGVDAGGTKTNARLYGTDGSEIFSAFSGFGNMLVERAAALENIKCAIAKCLEKVPNENGSGVFILVGAAGIAAGNGRTGMLGFLREQFPLCETAVETDGYLALYAALCGKDGILVISGTGSIAYGKLGGDIQRAGGWGQLLGDEGSGYHIAANALKRITREYDGEAVHTGLSDAILKHLDTDVFGMVKFTYESKKSEIAQLLKVVEEAAKSGDSFAVSLLENAGRSLAELAGTVYRKTGFDGAIPVAVSGGVLEKTPIVKSAFASALDSSKFILTDESRPAAAGAYYYWLSKLARGNTSEHTGLYQAGAGHK